MCRGSNRRTMAIKFCSLVSGSAANCQFVSSEKTKLLVDAGLSGKATKNALAQIEESIDNIQGILLTHEHSDHIAGVRVLMNRHRIPLYATAATLKAMAPKLSGTADYLYRPIPETSFSIGDMIVSSYPVSHDAVDPRCFMIKHEQCKLGIVTDLGWVDDHVILQFRDCDLLMIEANHDIDMLKMGRYPLHLKKRILSKRGHLSNDDAGAIAFESVIYGKVKHIVLAHLSNENNIPDVAFQTVKLAIERSGKIVGKDVMLSMTYRDKVGEVIYV